jgi:SAM-dependent methyltransferase/uncharacterized protein YbaR (Trm112 family)
MVVDPFLVDHLACPWDHAPVEIDGLGLRCTACGRAFAVVDGIPVMLRDDVTQTIAAANDSLNQVKGVPIAPAAPISPVPTPAASPPAPEGIDPFVQKAVAATCGTMYVPTIGKLTTYPIPSLRLPPGNGRVFVELGCGWGRWCIAAARAGYVPIGIDPMLGAVRAASRVATQLGVKAHFVTGDARYLPIRSDAADVVFSYSVLQHLSPESVAAVLTDVRRVLTPTGRFFAQFANALGARSLLVQARRGFRTATGFEVRYWTVRALRELAESRIGPTTIDVDGFLSINAQPADIPLLPGRYRLLVRVSEAIRGLATHAPWLVQVADSVYVSSARPTR